MLNNSLYQTIRREFDRRQAEQKYHQDLRIQEIYEKIPEYKDLDEELVTLCASEARARILAPNVRRKTKLAQFHKHVNKIHKQQAKLLHDAGFPEDYPELTYVCPLCKDTGFDGNDLCQCFRQAAAKVIFDQSQIASVLQAENFDTFRMDYYSDIIDPRFGISPLENMSTIVSECQQFIKNFKETYENLFITGNTGVGKSFLTHCIANELLKNAHSVLYLSAFDLIEAFEQHTFRNNEDIEELLYKDTLFDSILNCDVLFIDDLGTETVNNFTVTQLFLCLNHRLEHQKSTIISTNLPLEAIQDIYSERISSRIISYYHIFLIFGEDIRIKLACS